MCFSNTKEGVWFMGHRRTKKQRSRKITEGIFKKTPKLPYWIRTKYGDWWPFLFPNRLTIKGVVVYQWQEGVSFPEETRHRLLGFAIGEEQRAVLVAGDLDGGEIKKIILSSGQKIADGVHEFLKEFSQQPAKLVICAPNNLETVCHVYHGKHLVL